MLNFKSVISMAMLLVSAAVTVLVSSNRASAQTCPAGQTVIGMTPGGNGMAPQPICGGGSGGSDGGGQPEFRTGKAKVWGAAVRGGDGRIQVAYQYVSKKTALQAATGACMAKAANAGRCTTLANDITVFAVARGDDGLDYFGSETIDIDAAKIAMRECRKQAKGCQLIAIVDTVSGPRDTSIVLPFIND